MWAELGEPTTTCPREHVAFSVSGASFPRGGWRVGVRARGGLALTPQHLCLPPAHPIGHGLRGGCGPGAALNPPPFRTGQGVVPARSVPTPAPQQRPHASWPCGLPSISRSSHTCGRLGEPAVSGGSRVPPPLGAL